MEQGRSQLVSGEPVFGELSTPSLILDLAVLKRNLTRMAERLEGLGVAVRPHVKTHKCFEIAALQEQAGARGLTVSTLEEAADFIAAGFTDVTWAFPVILNRLEEVRRLADRATLRLLVDSPEAVDALESSRLSVHVWLKVDCGYHRAGVDPESSIALDLARRLHDSKSLTFDGILTHAGHGYHARSPAELLAVAREERKVMVDLATRLRGAGIDVPGISVGSTPTMSVVTDLDGVSEARPGNYAFHDWMQCGLGACQVADVALTVLTSVVSAQPGADHSVIDAGALSLSRDPGLDWAEPAGYGRFCLGGGVDGEVRDIESDFWVTSLSQEHGIVGRRLAVGQRLRILPNHSCLVAASFDHYHVVEAGRVVDRWAIHR